MGWRQKMAKALEKEFEYYLAHQAELVAKFDGKFVVIKGNEVLGAYDSEIEAMMGDFDT